MKRILALISSVLLCIALAGCQTPQNTITAVRLDEREKLLVSATTDGSFVFDFNVDETYTWLSVWVEQYIFGKKVANPAAKISCGAQRYGTIVVYMNQTDNAAAHPQMLNFFVQSGTNKYSQLNAVRDIDQTVRDTSARWSPNDKGTIPASGDMVLGCIRFSKAGTFSELSDEFFRDHKNHLDEIKGDDVTYIIRCGFSKKPS